MPAFKIKGVNCKQLNYASSSPSIRVFLQLHSQRAEGGPAQGTNLHLAFADFALSYQQLKKKSRKALIATPLGTISKQNKTTTAKENTTLYELFLYFFNLDETMYSR